MATQSAKASEIERKWYVVDAAAHVLRGKHRPEFTPHVDTGDFVIITNAAQISLSGNKLEDKYYHRHSGYPGGLHSESYGHLLERKPEFVVERAVKGMLPKNSLGRTGLIPTWHRSPRPFPFDLERIG
jgi:large subunit ribosomal protein L13